MKQLGRWLMLFSLIWSVCLGAGVSLSVQAEDANFAVSQQDVVAEVEANGSVRFVNTFTYDIKRLNSVQFDLNHQGSAIRNYRVGVQTEEDGELNYLSENYSASPSTFSAEQTNFGTRFQVYYPIEDASVPFVFEYTLDGLVTNYADTANLNYQLVSEQIESSHAFSAQIFLPGVVNNREDFQAWLHSDAPGEVFLTVENNRSVIHLTVATIPAQQTVEVNAIFPVSLTPHNLNVVEEDMKSEIIANEASLADAEVTAFEKARNRNLMLLLASLVFGPLSVLAAYGYYFRVREKLNPNRQILPEYLYSLPEAGITPAVMATSVFRSKPLADDFTATLLDLARKGFIDLSEVRKERRGVFTDGESSTLKISLAEGKDKNTLAAAPLLLHERQALNYILAGIDAQALIVEQDMTRQLLAQEAEEASRVKSVTLEQMEELSKKDKEFRKTQQISWKKFIDYAELNGNKRRGRRLPEARRARVFNLVALALSFGMGLVGIYVSLEVKASGLIVLAVVAFLVSLTASIGLILLRTKRPILTTEQDRTYQEWQAFAKMLTDIRQMNLRDLAPLAAWQEYIGYAMSLGVAEDLLEMMSEQYSEEELDDLNFDRHLITNTHLLPTVMRRSIADTLAAIDPGSNANNYSSGHSSSNDF